VGALAGHPGDHQGDGGDEQEDPERGGHWRRIVRDLSTV
jgi:hypothetical protein